jgi:hypothetical protein
MARTPTIETETALWIALDHSQAGTVGGARRHGCVFRVLSGVYATRWGEAIAGCSLDFDEPLE